MAALKTAGAPRRASGGSRYSADARHRAEPTEATAGAGEAATSLPEGPPLTSSEKDGLRLAVQRCWNVPAGLRDANELKVTLAAELAADGAVDQRLDPADRAEPGAGRRASSRPTRPGGGP